MKQTEADKNISAQEVLPEDRLKEIEAVSQELFGKVPDRVAFPGGESRSAFIADIDGQVCVFADRHNENSALLEANVLTVLSPTGHTPKFLARHGKWIVQECVPGIRLPVMLDQIPQMAEREKLLSQSLEALLQLHQAARTHGLDVHLQKIGAGSSWLKKQLSQGDIISEKLGLEKPSFLRGQVAQILSVSHTDFVKRDARPGNAMVFQGHPYWFDFEDCGKRRALDDLVWVIADEWTALDESAETSLLEKFIPLFAPNMEPAKARQYVYTYGTIHMMWRMRLVVKYYGKDTAWWDRDMCLEKDKVGVTCQEAGRLMWRMRRWAQNEPYFTGLDLWIDEVIRELDLQESANIP